MIFFSSLRTVLCESSIYTRYIFRDTRIVKINLENLAQMWRSVSVMGQITVWNYFQLNCVCASRIEESYKLNYSQLVCISHTCLRDVFMWLELVYLQNRIFFKSKIIDILFRQMIFTIFLTCLYAQFFFINPSSFCILSSITFSFSSTSSILTSLSSNLSSPASLSHFACQSSLTFSCKSSHFFNL